jgi:hypothetical protein
LRYVDPGWPETEAARCERGEPGLERKEPERFLRLSRVEEVGRERRAGLRGDDQSKVVSLRFGSVCGPVTEGCRREICRGDNSRGVEAVGRAMFGGRESRRKICLPLWLNDLAKGRLARLDEALEPALDGLAESL